MNQDSPRLSVTARIRILKFAEGVDPETGQPFEDTSHEVVLHGNEAKKLLDDMQKGVKHHGIDK